MRSTLKRLAVTAGTMLTGLTLAGCGGGGGRDSSLPPRDVPAPDLPVALVTGDPVIAGLGQVIRGELSCDGASCTLDILGESQTIDLSDLDPSSATVRITGERRRNGVGIGRIGATEDQLTLDSWGVWGDYNGGSASLMSGTFDGRTLQAVLPFSIGYATGSNPTRHPDGIEPGIFEWSGAMVGVKVGSRGIDAEVTGDATMRVVPFRDRLDLAFTNIAERSGARSPDIAWQDVPMRDGSFSDEGLDGRFYGPGHEEAGGVFRRDGIEGAFSLAQ